MGITKDPLDFNSETKPYELYKLELEAWTAVTDVKESWGQYVELSLPANDASDIRNKVFNGLMKEGRLKGEGWFEALKTFWMRSFKMKYWEFLVCLRHLRHIKERDR